MMLQRIFVWAFALFMFTAQVWAQEPLKSIDDPVKIFQEGIIQVVGMSEEGQSRVKALRAAEIVAKRDLLEIVQGLRLHGTTTVEAGMLSSDKIRTSVRGFLWGAVKCGQYYNPEKGYGEVCVKLNIRGKGGLYEEIWPLLKEKALGPAKGPTYTPPGSKIEQDTFSKSSVPNDGLILDVRGFQFKPALVNRILNDKTEVLFDPSVIPTKILIERGCGGYTTDLKKAKAMLGFWGSKRPMILKCIGVDDLTDAKIDASDAENLYRHDQETTLLAQARVVFIMK